MASLHCLGFHHLALTAADVPRVAAFYRDVLGLPELTRHHRPDGTLRSIWLGLGAGEGFLAVEAAEAPAGGEGRLAVVALRIAPGDRAAARAALAAAGVPVEKETGWTLYARDPEGTLVGLSHHPLPAPLD